MEVQNSQTHFKNWTILVLLKGWEIHEIQFLSKSFGQISASKSVEDWRKFFVANVLNRPKKIDFRTKIGQNWPFFGPKNRQKVSILGPKIGSRFWLNLHRLQGSEKRLFADKSAELATLRIFRLQWLGRDYSWIFVCWHNFL